MSVPAVIPSYKTFNLSTEWYLTKNVRLIAGVSNLTDEKYYSRAFLTGLIDPAPRRTGAPACRWSSKEPSGMVGRALRSARST